MGRVFGLWVVATCLTAGVVCPASGDVDGDGLAGAMDARLLMGWLTGEVAVLPAGESAGDLDGNGTANLLDLQLLLVRLTVPYLETENPTIHADRRNSDYIPVTMGTFRPDEDMQEIRWILRDPADPCVCMAGGAMGAENGEPVFYVTTGKVARPNLRAFRLSDGQEIWHAQLPADPWSPGPNSVALTSAPLLDNRGNIFVADGRWLFCYNVADPIDGYRVRQPRWRAVLPNLRVYNTADGRWRPSTDPLAPYAFARPFVSLFMTVASPLAKPYVGGITLDGDIYCFDPDTGDLFASGTLQSPPPDPIGDFGAPCDPALYALADDPATFNTSTDALSMFGIWCTGRAPETNDPDLDYFMNPCQIDPYLEANTFTAGSMISNTPAVTPDPTRPGVSRIFICGAQSALLAQGDLNPSVVDAFLYRVDFDPTAEPAKRFTVMNHEPAPQGGYLFDGRMPDGQNSATSPDVSPTDRWVYIGDRLGQFYAFSAEDGAVLWADAVGRMFGSATTAQEIGPDGLLHVYTFGENRIWCYGLDPHTGMIATLPGKGGPCRRTLDFKSFLTTTTWRTDDPRFAPTYVNSQDHEFYREGLGACYMICTRDRLQTVFSVGWMNPDNPSGMTVVPTHTAILYLDRSKIFSAPTAEETIDRWFRDLSGTCEISMWWSFRGPAPRAVMIYGSQATTFAHFVDLNNLIPTGMKGVYLRPYGGIRILEPPLAVYHPQ